MACPVINEMLRLLFTSMASREEAGNILISRSLEAEVFELQDEGEFIELDYKDDGARESHMALTGRSMGSLVLSTKVAVSPD